MSDRYVTSALRELRVFAQSWRFWTTFVLVVLLFAFTGPYGTSLSMAFGLRLAYWLIVHSATWTIAIGLSIIADTALRRHVPTRLGRMMIGSAIAAFPIGFALEAIDAGFPGYWAVPGGSGLQRVLPSMPISMLFCLLTYLAMHRQLAEASQETPGASSADNTATAAPAAAQPVHPPEHPFDAPLSLPLVQPAMERGAASSPAQAPSPACFPDIPILRRLHHRNRGDLVRLSVQDHYTEVVTSRGREFLLLRFADALDELGEIPGLQVHRSHWVADAHVVRLRRDKGKLVVLMKDGAEIPVSRANIETVRSRFAAL